MSRDRAKLIFDLQRQIQQLDNKLFMYGGHARKCRIKSTQYWMPEESCTCGWTQELDRMLEERMNNV